MRIVARDRACRMMMVVRRSWREASPDWNVHDRVRLRHGLGLSDLDWLETIVPPPEILAALSLCLIVIDSFVA